MNSASRFANFPTLGRRVALVFTIAFLLGLANAIALLFDFGKPASMDVYRLTLCVAAAYSLTAALLGAIGVNLMRALRASANTEAIRPVRRLATLLMLAAGLASLVYLTSLFAIVSRQAEGLTVFG